MACRALPGGRNEDYVAAGPEWAFVLDGATAPATVPSGCVHDVPWLVRELAGALTAGLAGDAPAPADTLAGAIGRVRAAHEGTCDLRNPDSPSSTVAIARWGRGRLECLVLADTPIAVRRADGTITVVDDDRLMHLPGGPPYPYELVRRMRNSAGGFWVASTSVAAAHEAVTASFPMEEVAEVVMCTDGVTRLIERYGYDWPGLFDLLREGGPDRIIDLVREAERDDADPPGKRHDDATVLFMTR